MSRTLAAPSVRSHRLVGRSALASPWRVVWLRCCETTQLGDVGVDT